MWISLLPESAPHCYTETNQYVSHKNCIAVILLAIVNLARRRRVR
jgi:hypothetical protein